MKDNFSSQAGAYARFRPQYPPELIAELVALAPARQAAWDCATGNGQVAYALAEHFEQVLATDISAKQLALAKTHPRIQYREEPAENCSASDHSFDLIVVAQAIHWFDFERFYAEVRRVLRPGGVLALVGYRMFRTENSALDAAIDHFYEHITGPYWDPERRYIDEEYRTIPFPFERIDLPEFALECRWTFEELIGYLSSWSAVQHYLRDTGENPIDLIEQDLRRAWGVGERLELQFPILLRVGLSWPDFFLNT